MGRYGRQPMDVVLAMSIPDMTLLARSVGKLMEQEKINASGEDD